MFAGSALLHKRNQEQQTKTTHQKHITNKLLNLQDDMSHHSVCTTKTRWHRAKFRVFGLEKFDGTGSNLMRLSSSYGKTVLHHVAQSGNLESLKFILSLYTESEEQLQSVIRRAPRSGTLLHRAVSSGNLSASKLCSIFIQNRSAWRL